LPGVARHLAAGRVPGGSKTNRGFLEPIVTVARPSPTPSASGRAHRDHDAQTSGGLLLCVPPAQVDAAVAGLTARGVTAAVIGALTERDSDGGERPIILR
jgi:selenide,water dikinase